MIVMGAIEMNTTACFELFPDVAKIDDYSQAFRLLLRVLGTCRAHACKTRKPFKSRKERTSSLTTAVLSSGWFPVKIIHMAPSKSCGDG